MNSGAEATENVVKIAQAATGRPAWSCSTTPTAAPARPGHDRQGRPTSRATSRSRARSTGCPTPIATGPLPPRPLDPRPGCADYIREIKVHVGPQNVACLIVEPVQGEGGFIAPPPAGWSGSPTCRRLGHPVRGRRGPVGLRPYRHPVRHRAAPGREPDFTLSAKSIAAGLPLAAVTGRAELMDAPGLGGSAAPTAATRWPA